MFYLITERFGMGFVFTFKILSSGVYNRAAAMLLMLDFSFI